MTNNVYNVYKGNEQPEYTLDDIREKVEEVKEKAENTIRKALSWALDHPGEAATIASAAIFGIRKLDKYFDIYRENKLRNSMIYDRSLGMYWETKRPLTANQRLTIESRHNAGESYGQILSDMKVLKR